VHLSPRSVRVTASRGLCDRSRRRTSRHPEPRSATVAATVGIVGASARLVPDRRTTGRRTTIVSRAGARCGSAHSIDHTFVRPTGDTMTVPQSRLVRMVVWYQRVREGHPSPCRFTPTCSAYAVDALEQHGTWRGLSLSLRRLLRCRPFGPSGWDPVPDAPSRKRANAR
jgi:uncharacterized protein